MRLSAHKRLDSAAVAIGSPYTSDFRDCFTHATVRASSRRRRDSSFVVLDNVGTMAEVHEDVTAIGITVPSSHLMSSSTLASSMGCQLLVPVVHTDSVIVGDEVDEQPITQDTQDIESITIEPMVNQISDEVSNKVGQTFIVPEVGMSFDSEEKTYDMYNTYAGKIGFSIRKSDIKRRGDGSICHKHIICSSQGHRQTESSKDTTRTGCNARVQFSVSKEGVWTVYKVVLDHNHYLASPFCRDPNEVFKKQIRS